MDGSDTRRIVILGTTGAGKSSLDNTIFREKLFRVSRRRVTLIDTPDFFDTEKSEEDLKPEILSCLTDCSPGPHAFLIMLKKERHNEHVLDVINKIQDYFSEDVFKYATVVFTHGDELDEGQTIEDFVHENNFLSVLVQKCGGRCHVIDNKYWNKQHEYRSNEVQVEKILKTIDKMVEENNGGCYTNEMLQAVEAKIQEEKRMSQQLRNMSEEETREKANSGCTEEIPQNTSTSLSGSDTRRIVILGRTASGKSSLANTIFKKKQFRVGNSPFSETGRCDVKSKRVNGRILTLIDTPGFFGTHRSEEDLKPEILRCIIECSPGPHAFLIVLKVGKFTKQEQEVIVKIQQYFSDEVFKYATVVFTHGDQLVEGQTIEDFVHHNKSLRVLVQKCGGRCHVIDNRYWNKEHEYKSNEVQVEQILKTIDEMVEANNGGCYTNEILRSSGLVLQWQRWLKVLKDVM